MSRMSKKETTGGEGGKGSSTGGLDARLKSAQFKCDICNNKFRLSEKVKFKDRCYECYHAMKDTMLVCPLCKNEYSMKNMCRVNMFVKPGKKGGKKYIAYYCMYCIGKVTSRCREIHENQDQSLKNAAKIQRKNMRQFIR